MPGGDRAGAAVTVRLRTPPPLDLPLQVGIDDGGRAVACRGDVLVAEAAVATWQLDPVPPVPYESAVFATSRYAGFRQHPFPECVVCGPHRAPGDGLRLFPGRTVPGRTAAPWRPEDSLADSAGTVLPEIVWAALDCPGGWAAEIEGRPMVLGTMTARIDATPAVGEQCVVTGELRLTAGRRAETATSLYGENGRSLAHAYAIWVEIDATAFNRFFAPSAAHRSLERAEGA